MKSFAMMMVENRILLNWKLAFRNAKYIIMIEEKLGDQHGGWEGKVKSIEKILDKSV